jgi:hypothetical protein
MHWLRDEEDNEADASAKALRFLDWLLDWLLELELAPP